MSYSKRFSLAMQAAISMKNGALYKDAYTVLTNICNNYYRSVKHPVNVIQTLIEHPFMDRHFKPQPLQLKHGF